MLCRAATQRLLRTAAVARSAQPVLALARPADALQRPAALAARWHPRHASTAAGDKPSNEVAAQPEPEPTAAAATSPPPVTDGPMDPAEFRRQQEAAGYVMARKKRLRSSLSDHAPPGTSHDLFNQGVDVHADELVAGRNASEKEDDETHARFESVLTAFIAISLAVWLIVSFNDIKGVITGERVPEIQTQIPVRYHPP